MLPKKDDLMEEQNVSLYLGLALLVVEDMKHEEGFFDSGRRRLS